jgi:HPr kinase/phosphorylase
MSTDGRTIRALDTEHPSETQDAIYRQLFDPQRPFDRFNPLDPKPIALLDEPLRQALKGYPNPSIAETDIWVLTDISPDMAQSWISEQKQVPDVILHSPMTQAQITDWFQTQRKQSARQWQHGVFMEVAGSGVLITGESGIGKSELALELLSRGHRLIADDAPYFVRGNQGIEGSCPESIRDHLEADHKTLRAESRLHGERSKVTICGESIPLFRLPVAPGRNIAVFVETVVRQHNLERSGFGERLFGQPYPAEWHPYPGDKTPTP